MKIVTIVGARPQFIKSSVVSRSIANYNKLISIPSFNISEIIVHTGQHFDKNMSQVFFEELKIPEPQYNLGISNLSHGKMTGRMLEKIESVLLDVKPDLVMVYGDTNSTLAGALAASKLHIPVAHVEAGLRSYNRKMPEEINRVLTDHIASLLFCPTEKAVNNLRQEGIDNSNNVFHVGDVMYDSCLYYSSKYQAKCSIIEQLDLEPKEYLLATVHREENTDNQTRLDAIFEGLTQLTNDLPVVLSLHPRTRNALNNKDMLRDLIQSLKIIEPVGYLDMLMLEKNSRIIITDSGGIQKEAFFHKVPCITLRNETEWVELVETGWNVLVGTDKELLMQEVQRFLSNENLPSVHPNLYGTGQSGSEIIEIICGFDNS